MAEDEGVENHVFLTMAILAGVNQRPSLFD